MQFHIKFRIKNYNNFLTRQVSVNHLRAAPHRLEQMAILCVLCRYTEYVSATELKADNRNDDIMVAIAKLGTKPSPKVNIQAVVN